jgi:hypothetical protein
MGVRALPRSVLAVACALCACAGASKGSPGTPQPTSLAGGPSSVHALYELGPSPMRFLAIPWPDDAYLDAGGHVSVRELPTDASSDYAQALVDGMHDLDGFGLRPTVYFRFDGALDPASLPADPQASLSASSSVFLVDVDTASSRAFERVPVDVEYVAGSLELRLRPALPSVLNPGRRYAVVVTRALLGAEGHPVAAAERFLRVRDSEVPLANPRERAARAEYAPVLQTLASHGLTQDKVVALAVFHVQTVRTDLMDARDLVNKAPAAAPTLTEARGQAELDALLGSPPTGAVGLDSGGPHEHIGWMVSGSFSAANLISTRANVHGVFERNAGGELRAKRQDDIHFTLWLPLGSTASAALPVVIMQHGLGGERSDALPVANALAASGYAVIAIDAPFHGLRSGAGDSSNRFTGRPTADGFGDAPGDFVGQSDLAGDLVDFHPFYYRDAVRQGVVDLMSLVHLLKDGDWSRLGKLEPALSGIALKTTSLSFVGIDLGAEMGLILASLEPSLAGLVLAFGSGQGLDGWFDTPAQRSLVDSLLTRLGRDPTQRDVDYPQLLRSPDLDAWRTLTDRASALAFTPALSRLPVNVFMLMARDDEVVHNRGTELLASALGAVLVGGDPAYVHELKTESIRPGATSSGNFAADGGSVTRVLYELDPATHDGLTLAVGERQYQHPVAPPFTLLPNASRVDNPIATTMTQLAFFFESLRTCATTTPPTTCAGSVEAPVAR